MKLHKKLSGDPVEVDVKPGVEEIASVPIETAAPVVTLPPNHRWAELLDVNGHHPQRVAVAENHFGRQIVVKGILYRHVSDHPDGTWQFMV